jgi:parvulin-like peptidyl-prolyl isomerase
MSTAPTSPTLGSGPLYEAIKPRVLSKELIPLARLDGTTITNQSLSRWLDVVQPAALTGFPPSAILSLPGDQVALVIATLALYDMARRESLQDKDFPTSGLLDEIKAKQQITLQGGYLEREVFDKITSMTTEQARQYYKDNLHLYVQPFAFAAQAIYLTTYRPHVMKKGEKLPQIAQQIAGTSAAATLILDSKTSVPIIDLLSNPYAPRFEPREDMVVWVPRKPEEKQAVRKQMEDIVAQLAAGTTFSLLAAQYSFEPPELRGQIVGPLPSPGRPTLQPVLDAGRRTPPGGVTPIIETPHGYVLLRILNKTTQSIQRFEEVEGDIIRREIQERREAAIKDFRESLFSPPLLELDKKVFMMDKAPSSAVIARVGKAAYTWGQFREEQNLKYWAPPSFEARLDLLKKSAILSDLLLAERVRRSGIEKDPVIAARLDAVDMGVRGPRYLDYYLQKKIRIPEARLREFYQKNRDRYQVPGKYRLAEAILKIDPEQAKDQKLLNARVQYLQEEARRIKNYKQFLTFAREMANWPVAADERGQLKEVEEDYRGPDFGQQLAHLEPGKVAGPYGVGDELFLVWLESRTPRQYRPFEEVRSEVEADYRRALAADLVAQGEREIRSRHRLEYLFSFVKKDKPDSAPMEPLKS